MSVELKSAVSRYYGPTPTNPVYSDGIKNLIDSGLYTSALAYGDAVNPAIPGNILQYENGLGAPKSAVPLEVLVDSITKAILSNLKDGFVGSVDSAVNINFKNTSTNTNLNVDNIHSAIVRLGNEVALLRTTLASLLGEPAFSSTLATTNQTTLVDDKTKYNL